MKRLIVFIVTFANLVCALYIPANAQTDICIKAQVSFFFSDESSPVPSSVSERFGSLTQTQLTNLSNSLYECLWNMQESLNVSKYGFYLQKSDGNYYIDPCLVNIYSEVIAAYPYLFNTKEFQVSANSSTLKITSISPIYNISFEEYQSRIEYCKSEIEDIICDIPQNFTEKVIYIQDYIALNFAYDTRLFSSDSAQVAKAVSDMYGFFKQKVGVCQGYTAAFNAIMQRLGIESESVIDRTDNHIWNIVKLEDEYYHLDCTHDDPVFTDSSGSTYDFKGLVRHTCLLLNDSEMSLQKGHSEWHTPLSFSDVICDSDKFSNASFRNIHTPLGYYNGYWYGAEALLPTTIYKLTNDFTSKEQLYSLDLNYSGSINEIKGSFILGNCLYINSLYSVIRLNLDTLTADTLYTSDNIINTIYPYGEGYVGVVENYDYTNSKDNKFRLKIGDINCDNSIDAIDLSSIVNYILQQPDSFFSETLSDINLDGTTNLIDLIRLKKYLVGIITVI